MRLDGITAVILVGVTWLSVCPASPAQIVPYFDERGKLVYVNGDSAKDGHGSTISPAPGAGPVRPSLAPLGNASPFSRNALRFDSQLDRIVSEVAQRHSLDPALVKAVISTESAWNPWAVSRKGAMGLMQLIPETAQRFGVGNPYDPVQNVEGGTTYLKALLDRYKGDLNKTLAAYNAGERAVDASGGIPPTRETRRYVRKVTDAYFEPGSDHEPLPWMERKNSVRREVDSRGRVVFTNE